MRLGRVFEFDSVDSWIHQAAEDIHVAILEKLQEKSQVWLALSGGTTPLPIYKNLAHRLDQLSSQRQSNIHILLVDERAVEFTDPRSNSKLIYDAFHETQVSMHLVSDAVNAENAAFHYSLYLNQNCIDLIVLGMGDDGHTASLFPNMASLESNSNAFIVTDSPVDPYTRISLTLEAIKAVKRRFVLVRGPQKKTLMDHLSRASKPEWPIDRVISDQGTPLNWYWTR